MVDRMHRNFIPFCIACFAAGSVFTCQGEQLGNRSDPLSVKENPIAELDAPRFALEAPATDVATVGTSNEFSGSVLEGSSLLTGESDVSWDEPLIASPRASAPAPAAATQASYSVASTGGALPPVTAEPALQQAGTESAPMPALSAVPAADIEGIATSHVDDERSETRPSDVLEVRPEPSGKTLLAALLGSLVLIGGFTHFLRPRNEKVQPIRFH